MRVVSFDLWDTVFIDDSDEPKRAQAGKPSKVIERRDLVERFLIEHGNGGRTAPTRALIDTAYATADAAFRHVWYGQSVTWSVRERLDIVLTGLGAALPESAMQKLVRLHEEMELTFMPDLVPGAAEAVAALHGRYKLAVVSDAIFTPGRVLRQILEAYGLLRYFDAFVFSDEIGASKPHPRCFEKVAEACGCPLTSIVHLGDREAKDIDGPLAVGARGILVPIVKDRGGGAKSRAAAVCRDYKELPAILSGLD